MVNRIVDIYRYHWAFGIGLYGMPGIMVSALQFYLVLANQLCQSLFEGGHLLPSQLPGEHTVVLHHTVHSTFKPFAIMTSFLPYTG